MMTISPGSTSRTNSAWIWSSATDSLASTHAPFTRPNAQRTEPERVARADQFLLRHDDQRIRAFDAAERLHQRVLDAVERRLREHHDDDFAVHGRLENQPVIFQFVAELRGVGQIAVVGDGDLAARAIHRERLGVAEIGRAGGGITRVADGHVADQIVQQSRD